MLLVDPLAESLAEDSEGVVLLAEPLWQDSGAGLVTNALKDTPEATNSNAEKKVSPEGLGGAACFGAGGAFG